MPTLVEMGNEFATNERAAELARQYWAASVPPGPRGRITRATKVAHETQLRLLQQVAAELGVDAVVAMRFINLYKGGQDG